MPRGKKKGTPARNKEAAKDIVGRANADKSGKRTNAHQEKPAKKSKDKETVKVEVDCPCCKEKITVRVFKEITQKAISAEYRLYGIAEKEPQAQLDLGLDPKDGAGPKATATAKKKDAPGGGRKKAI